MLDSKCMRSNVSNIPKGPTARSPELRNNTLCLDHLSPTNAKTGKKRKKKARNALVIRNGSSPMMAGTKWLDINGWADVRNTVASNRLHISTSALPLE